jgi:hypothetical protein
MAKPNKLQLSDLPAEYNFVLNPYPDQRLSRCPYCEGKTGQRKVPLFIHVDPGYPIALNYTCRYCKSCDLLIAHKHEIEHLLAGMFSQYVSSIIGNEYLIIGTVEKKVWREGLTQPKAVAEMLPHVHIFRNYYQELRMTQPGWYPADQEPPVMPPPPSTEWVKPKRQRRKRRKRRF